MFFALAVGLRAEPVVSGGEIGGAPYAVWRPAVGVADNGILLLLAPGYKPEDAPREARLDTSAAFLRTRHEAGWTIAATAYRKNGWAVREGVEDVAALAAKLEAEHGPFRHVLVVGESMGGLIAVRLMESAEHAPSFSGALGLGAALAVEPARLVELGGDAADLEFTHRPLRPVLLASNRNELAGPLAYVAQVAAGPAHRYAAAQVIDRPGHVNLSEAERGRTIEWIYNWASGEPPALLADATVAVPATPLAGEVTEGGLRAKVTRIDPDFGNVDFSASLADLEKLGLGLGSTIGIRAESAATGEAKLAFVGDRYAAVPRGEWVLVVLPDGQLRLAINMGHAGKGLGVAVGDAVVLSPLK